MRNLRKGQMRVGISRTPQLLGTVPKYPLICLAFMNADLDLGKASFEVEDKARIYRIKQLNLSKLNNTIE